MLATDPACQSVKNFQFATAPILECPPEVLEGDMCTYVLDSRQLVFGTPSKSLGSPRGKTRTDKLVRTRIVSRRSIYL